MSEPLSPQAENILKDLARDHGLSRLDADDEGLVEVTLDDRVTIAFAFSELMCVMTSVVSESSEAAQADPWIMFDAPADWADRRTRLAIEPDSKALMLNRDILLEGLSYGEFAKAFEAFANDVEAAQALVGNSKGGSSGQGQSDTEFAATTEEQMIFRP